MAQENRRELKTNSNLNSWGPHSWYPRGKGGGKPIAEDAGVKGEKGARREIKGLERKTGGKMEATEGSSSAHERSSSSERVDTPISVCDSPSDVEETRQSADKG